MAQIPEPIRLLSGFNSSDYSYVSKPATIGDLMAIQTVDAAQQSSISGLLFATHDLSFNAVAGTTTIARNAVIGGALNVGGAVGIGDMTCGKITMSKNILINNALSNITVASGTFLNTVSGSGDTVIGSNAGNGNSLLATNSTLIGNNTGCPSLSGTIFTNVTCLGNGAACLNSNEVQAGNSATTLYYYASSARSDARDKANVEDEVLGLDYINVLRPKTYCWNYREDYITQDLSGNLVELPNDGSKQRTRRHHGFLAQDCLSLCGTFGDFAGLTLRNYNNPNPNAQNDVWSLNYQEFVSILTKGIQEMSAKIDALTARVTALENP